MAQSPLQDKIKQIKVDFKKNVNKLDTDTLHVSYLGKKGFINQLLKEMTNVSPDERISSAKEINLLKQQIVTEITELRTKTADFISPEIDMTLPVQPTRTGHMHPISYVNRQLNQFFHYYGFSVIDGPEIENDYYNFEMMGVSQDHPARELQDTLYIMEPDVLLRTQTSNVEARELENREPPIRFVFGGKTFRNETANKSNASMFYQYQGVYLDENVTMGHLKWMFSESLKFILGDDIEIRFRAKYYPEVEPGLSPDIKCTFCKGDGCDVCKNRGWVEIAGGGMIHPTTLEKANIDPKKYSGFAFGWGLDRIAMARFNINDIRVLFNGSMMYKS